MLGQIHIELTDICEEPGSCDLACFRLLKLEESVGDLDCEQDVTAAFGGLTSQGEYSSSWRSFSRRSLELPADILLASLANPRRTDD